MELRIEFSGVRGPMEKHKVFFFGGEGVFYGNVETVGEIW